MSSSDLPPSSLLHLEPDLQKRSKTIARKAISIGSTILSSPALATALLDTEKGLRCDHCLCLPRNNPTLPLKRCSGCGSYWYCDTKCQNDHWQAGHKRLCKRIGPFVNSVTFQRLEKHERMDSLLLTHLLAHLSTIPDPYSPGISKDLAILLALLPGPAEVGLPPYFAIKPAPPSQNWVSGLFKRFGNNNFTIHSHLNAIAHGIFPVASRLFNHSCVPNAVAKYVLSHGSVVAIEVVSLRDIRSAEEICIPYIDPALMQTRQQVFQITYGFACECPSCSFLNQAGPLPSLPSSDASQLGLQLREFVGVDAYLKTGTFSAKTLDALSSSLYCVLNESYMNGLSESFSKSAHEGDYAQAAESGITLLALYLLVYPKTYPQIGMHLLEMAKTQWNHSFIDSNPATLADRDDAKHIVSQLLTLSRSVLQVLGAEGDSENGPFVEISVLENLVREA